MTRAAKFAFIAALWALFGIVTGSITVALFPAVLRDRTIVAVLAAQVIPWLCWAVFTPVISALVDRFPLDGRSMRRSLPVHVLAAVGCVVAYTVVSALVSRAMVASETSQSIGALIRGFLVSRMTLGIIAYGAIAGVKIAVDERQERRAQTVRAMELSGDLMRAQLRSLQMQLQPHFLFNTLHAVQHLIHEDPASASRIVTRLGELLRLTLALTNVPSIPLREERDVLDKYLEIEQMRFASRLVIIVDIPEELLDYEVPTFILQPIVENAIRHGVEPRNRPGRVTIHASRESDCLLMTVEDDGPGFTAPVDDVGLGLRSSRERLAVLFGDSGALSCENTLHGGARVTIRIPIDRD